MKGTIKTIIADKHFGFITPEDASKDVFFHESGLVGVQFAELTAGMLVSFDVEQSEKGPRAVNVTRAEAA
ncbi:MAG: cold shock domain-containing protein [Patescibacteria group bacterium]